MNLVYSQEQPEDVGSGSIFLAGPSPRQDGGFNWRPDAIELLEKQGFNGSVFIPLPRDGNWPRDYDKQVDWELKYLNYSTVIIFWIPRDVYLPGFTTNVEFGMFLKTGKIVLGYPENAEKMKYLDYVARLNNIPISNDLEGTIKNSLDKLKNLV